MAEIIFVHKNNRMILQYMYVYSWTLLERQIRLVRMCKVFILSEFIADGDKTAHSWRNKRKMQPDISREESKLPSL